MKRILLLAVAVAVALVFTCSQSFAISKDYQRKGAQVIQGGKDAKPYQDPAQVEKQTYEKGDFHKKVKVSDFPEKGWHKGPYIAANIGMMQLTNDKHVVTDRKFDGSMIPAYGITFGWDIADWIGPMLQISFGTATDQVGDAANTSSLGGGPTSYPSNPGVTFPVDTFPVENARQYALDVSIFAKATVPYFVRAAWQPKNVKIIPYAKLGGTAHGVFNRAPTAANMAGAFGGGPAIGLGCEFLVWKGFFIAIDATEHLIFQQSVKKDITTTTGSQNFEIIKGGFSPQFSFAGHFGWHF